ncbi:alpha/beta hydrolase [Catenulispora yoronensis]|uniref:Alpha/beta hydrolase n=1 Tax=Catenulispora yoronensis TaxID=450799 RepID=A0ABN2U9B8_9ACTN
MRNDITFQSNGLKIAGHLYLPDAPAGSPTNVPVDGPRPAVVVGHPGTGVKEQTAGLYARRLAENGFVALAFDAAYQGESEGLPRGLEDPAQRVEDLKAAVSFLTARGEVDPERIGVLGICASGGYALTATATDHRIKAVGTVSAMDIARQFRLGADGTQDPAVFQGLLDAAAAARTAEARGAGTQSFPLFPDSEEAARAGGRHNFEGWEYYCTARGAHPRSTKVLPWSSVDRIGTYDASQSVPLIGQRPLIMVAGTEAVTSWVSVDAFQRATGPKQTVWVDGATHVDLYDVEKYVETAVEALTGFYRASLAETAKHIEG